MKNLREHPLDDIAGEKVAVRKDYSTGTLPHVADGLTEAMELKDSNVLEYDFEDGSKLLVRPSGTEPKVKVYILMHGGTMESCKERTAKLAAWADGLRK